METKKSESTATSSSFQLVWIAISIFALVFLIMGRIRNYYPNDESPQLLPITPDQALQFGGTPAVVKIGFYLANYSEFNIANNDFTFNGTLWFEFDPSTISLNTVKQFTFEKGELLSISEPTTKFIGNKLLVSYDVRIRKKDNLNYAFFPFDDHVLTFVVANRASPAELVYESAYSDFSLSKVVEEQGGWTVLGKHVETGYSTATLQDNKDKEVIHHPRALFSIDYSLSAYRRLLTIFLPLILIFYIIIFSFSLEPVSNYRSIITLSSGGVTGILAYRFVIENLSPKTGYLMLSDYIFFLFLAAACVLFLINTHTIELSKRAKEIITILTHGTIIVAMYYLLNYFVN